MRPRTFVKGARETVVWNPKSDRPLAEFVNGLYETSDPSTIQTLTNLGYKERNEYPNGPPIEGFQPEPGEAAELDTGSPNVNVVTSKSEMQAMLQHAIKHDVPEEAKEERETGTPLQRKSVKRPSQS